MKCAFPTDNTAAPIANYRAPAPHVLPAGRCGALSDCGGCILADFRLAVVRIAIAVLAARHQRGTGRLQ